MAQSERSTSILLQDSNIAAIAQTTRAYIAVGSTIRASDLNNIAYMINIMYGHAHYHNDYAQLPTYGNNGDRSAYERANVTTSNTVNDAGGYLVNDGSTPQATAGNLISPYHHNQFNDKLKKVRSHTHYTYDYTTTSG